MFPVHRYLLIAALLLTVFAAFSPALFNGFVNMDDDILLTENPEVRSLSVDHLQTIFTSTSTGGYVPLTILSFALEYHFFGLNPFIYHLDNILLHLLVVGLVLWLAMRLGIGIWGAFLAALVFGLHPTRVESVAWVAERKDVLFAVFYLLAVHAHLSYLDEPKKRFLIGSLMLGCLSMLAKPMALSLPLILLLLDWKKKRVIDGAAIAEKLAHGLYIVPLALVTYAFHPAQAQGSWMEMALTLIWSSAFYLWTFCCPWTLLPLHVRPEPVSLANPVYAASFLTVLFVMAGVFVGRKNRWVLFAAGFYALSIFCVLRVNADAVSVVADRYLYLPGIGLSLLIGYAAERVWMSRPQWRIFLLTAVVVILGLLTIKTVFQIRIWKNSLSVCAQVIDHGVNHWMAFYNRGMVAQKDGRYDVSEPDFSRALSISPQAMVYNNRAIARTHLNRLPEALDDLNRAIELRPDYVLAYGNRGLVYSRLGRFDLAIDDFSRGIALQPDAAALRHYRFLACVELGRFEEALRDALKARELGYPNMDKEIEELKKYISAR